MPTNAEMLLLSAAIFALLILGASFCSKVLLAVGCADNVSSGTQRGDVCGAAAPFEAPVGWFILMFAPAIAALASATLLRGTRARVVAAAILAVAIATDALRLSIVAGHSPL